MRTRKNWTGMKSGKLTVIRYADTPNRLVCQCECGNITEVTTSNFRKTHSCGCSKTESIHKRSIEERKAMIGEVFGRLRVIGCSETPGYLICECECGTIKEIRKVNLMKAYKPTRSCGCIQKEIARKECLEHTEKRVAAYVEECKNYQTNFRVIGRQKPQKNNSSGHVGVCVRKRDNKYLAYLYVHHKRIGLGVYTSYEDAVKAREEGEKKYYLPLIEAKQKSEKNGSLT